MSNREKSYVFHGMTTSLCSSCMAKVPAKILLRPHGVFLQKRCDIHGIHEELLEEDCEFYLKQYQYQKPGTQSATQTEYNCGCPHDCGLCPDHEQHTCIGVLEVTNKCDLACPVCFAVADEGTPLPLEQIARMLDLFIQSESGAAEILQISGGEPTTHPQIIDIIKLARAKGIRYVMLNTNGLRIATDPAFVTELSQFVGGFEVYLQFDGFTAGTYDYLRGRDLTALKQQAVAALTAHKIPITLVATLLRGINEDEIGHLVEFGINTAGIRGINFQPMAFFGRVPEEQYPTDRLTSTGILRAIEKQTKGMIRRDDFIPLPCDPGRVAITLLYRSGGEFVPLTRHLDPRKYLPLFDNTLAVYAEDIVDNALRDLCGGKTCNCLGFIKDCLPMSSLGMKALFSRDKVQFGTDNLFRITSTSFIDRFNFDMHSMKQECVHVLTPDLRKIPFSAYNIFYREQVKP